VVVDGIHDLGGLDGFGAVEIEPDEPVFHDEWERRAFRFTAAAGRAADYSGGAFRHSIERMDPGHYLTSSYYEHWLTGVTTLLVEAGITTADELDHRAGGHFPLSRPDRGDDPGWTEHTEPVFAVGDRIRVREWHPFGHTRAPRYVQGKRGVIVRCDGAHNLPDVEAHGPRRVLDPTYSVRFTARELWGELAGERDTVHVDLWERYLEEDS
jgi:nitrile hydratase